MFPSLPTTVAVHLLAKHPEDNCCCCVWLLRVMEWIKTVHSAAFISSSTDSDGTLLFSLSKQEDIELPEVGCCCNWDLVSNLDLCRCVEIKWSAVLTSPRCSISVLGISNWDSRVVLWLSKHWACSLFVSVDVGFRSISLAHVLCMYPLSLG